jgi:hypothetical protein
LTSVNDPRKSSYEWTWQEGAQNCAVRVFPVTRRLIWSSSVDTSDGPVFDAGIAQTYKQFLRGDPPPYSVPSIILDDVRALVAYEDRKRGLFGWLRK